MTTLLYRHASSLSLICLLVLSGCVRGSGIPATEVRDLGGFSEIQNDIMVDVIFAPADTQRVELTCDDNLLDRILTEVSGDTLKIKTPPGSGISPQGVCELWIEAPCLRSVSLTGAGDFTAEGEACALEAIQISGSGGVSAEVVGSTLSIDTSGSGGVHLIADVERLIVASDGAGDVQIEGTATEVEADLSSAGSLLARETTAEHAVLQVSGSGGVALTVTGSAEVDTSGSGSVDLWGSPQVDSHSSGSGSVNLH